MSLSSDTESECEGSVSCWDPTDFMEMSSMEPSGDMHISHLQHAIETLSSISICGIEDDQLVLEQVWSASGTIQRSLDFVIGLVPSDENGWVQVQEILRLFLDPSVLAMLFEYRAAIYDLAARNADGQTLIVCWVDLVLAKMGQAVIAVAGSLYRIVPSHRDQPSSILARRDDDKLRAAAQLPESWSDVVGVLCSEHHSPAAIRLATTLIFGVNVMLPRVAGNMSTIDSDSERWQALLRVLDEWVKKTIIHDRMGIQINIEDPNEEDRIAYAMFVSLYAVAASTDLATLDLTCRPQSSATLVDMIQIVLRLKPNPSILSVLSPTAVLDNATTILIGWGMAIPWSWTTWMDARLHNSEIIEHLSVVWLHTVEIPPEATLWPMNASSKGDDLTTSLMGYPLPALSMMMRLLLYILRGVSDTNSRSASLALGELTVKICWSVKYLLRTVEVDGPSLLVICETLCKLFALLPDGEPELDARESILEIISSFPSSLKAATNVFSDPRAKCYGKLNERLVASSRLLLDKSSCSSMRITRQTTQFLTLLWMTGTPRFFNPDAIHRFLSSLCDTLCSDSQAQKTLGDAAICLLSVIKSRRDDPTFQPVGRCYEVQLIWASSGDPADLLLASSLATYVSASTGSRDSHLLWADTWSYFCDVLRLILEKEFVGPGLEESLSLFVAPGICRALLSLLEIATDHALRCCISSPWTTSLMTELKKLHLIGDSTSGGGEDYATILRQRISPIAELLYKHLEPRSDPPKNAPPPVWESVFCLIRSIPCLILSVN